MALRRQVKELEVLEEMSEQPIALVAAMHVKEVILVSPPHNLHLFHKP